ncbi:hypothetical protein Tco_0577688 [Tanacetum coccineum]
MNEFNKYYDSVDQTLALRNDMPIRRFVLDCSKTCDYTRVYDLVSIVVQCKVQQLELRFLDDGNWVRLCWDLFKTCNTLVELTLKGEFVLDVPENELLFPRSNKMDLVNRGQRRSTVVNRDQTCRKPSNLAGSI